MGKYTSFSTRQEKPRRDREVHPIWRLIGLAMILLIPFLSFVAALAILDENTRSNWFRIPRDLILRGNSDPLLLVKVLITVAIAFVLYVIFTLITFSMYRFFGPSRYGPYDVPQVSYRGKKNVR